MPPRKKGRPDTFESDVCHAMTLLSIGGTSDQLADWARDEYPSDAQPDVAAVELEARTRIQRNAGDGVSWATACRLQRLADLYARSLHIQDYKTCLSVEKETALAKREAAAEQRKAAREGKPAAIVELVEKPKPARAPTRARTTTKAKPAAKAKPKPKATTRKKATK